MMDRCSAEEFLPCATIGCERLEQRAYTELVYLIGAAQQRAWDREAERFLAAVRLMT